MPARLQIKLEDCSPLGQLILQYLEDVGISMNRLAELSGIPQPRLRGACFKGTCPTPETLRKLARVMGKHHLELYTLAYEGRIETQPEDAEDYSLDMLMRELFSTAREIGFTAPKSRPSKTQIRKALVALGFQSEANDPLIQEALRAANTPKTM
ncbi:MAG: helix-turn-helix domain-containing protein [Scytolyngbya sp. HA4215-MV1]|jgi:plasmid maintenance system antidote protein VapI|nr:helix-turn-helix domain-containing protein [Scytolyngbya sp. HA4215-MV1]